MATDELELGVEAPAPGGRMAAVKALGAEDPPKPETVTDEQIEDGLAWFLEDAEADLQDAVATLSVDVAPAGAAVSRMLTLKVRPISSEVLKRAREEGERGASNRAARRSGGAADPHRIALYIAAAAIVEPDLLEAARRKGVTPAADPTITKMHVLAHRLAHKPMLVDQVSDRVLAISGLDESDISEVAGMAVRAGKP